MENPKEIRQIFRDALSRHYVFRYTEEAATRNLSISEKNSDFHSVGATQSVAIPVGHTEILL